jgi:hypothetical protein
VAGRRRRAGVDREVARLRSELDESRPYLGLAREIHEEVERAVADSTTDLDELADALGHWPQDARRAAVTAAFRELPALEQWEILARLFDDDELRGALAVEHRRRLAEARTTLNGAALAAAVRERRVLDTRDVPAGEDLALGLFREVDVRGAVTRGSASTSTARRIVLRSTDEPGRLLVLEDVFNPARGLFVTTDYDEVAWREERLSPHATVRVGAAPDGAPFEPVLYPGGRLDVETVDGICRGRLHLGYATVGAVDLFTPSEGDRLT